MSVSQAQACISSAEYAEWIAFNNIEHFTVDTSEYLLAVLCSIIANTNRKPSTKPYKPVDFLPKFGEPKKQSAQEMEITLRALLHGNHK